MHTQRKYLVLVVLSLSMLASAEVIEVSDAEFALIDSQTDMDIVIARLHEDSTATSGILSVNGIILCHTLELPWKDNQQGISSVPPGTYAGHLRYDKEDRWRIQLDEVEGRSGIQLHIGNVTSETSGCILVGSDIAEDKHSLKKSSQAYRYLKRAFYGTFEPNSTPNKKISVTIKSSTA